MNKLLIILGLTSTGKTDLALNLAKKFNGELIACDSRQVYRGLDIGTGKMPFGKWMMDDGRIQKKKGYWEIDGVKVWMYDVVDLRSQYTVADYIKEANKVISVIEGRGKLPIIVGGTGLYLRALFEDMPDLAISGNKKLRLELQKLSKDELQKKLHKLSVVRWKKMNDSDKQNPRRLIRAIELIVMKPKKTQYTESKLKDFNILKIGLIAPKEVMDKKINNKVLEWIKDGIIKEVKGFLKKDISKKRIMVLGLEYAVIIEFLNKTISSSQMIEKMQTKVRQYAKRQLTWFKKEKEVFWFDVDKKNYEDQVANLVSKWYYSG